MAEWSRLRTWRFAPFQGLRFETSEVLSIPELDQSIRGFSPILIGPPASEWWDFSPGLDGPWAGYLVIKKRISALS